MVASEMAFIAIGHAALACSFIVPQNPGGFALGGGDGCGGWSWFFSGLIVATPV